MIKSSLDEQELREEEEYNRWHKKYGTFWVNVYSIHRCFGGPEEGGWWYDTGDPVASIPVKGLSRAEHLAKAWRKQCPKTNKRYSVLGGEDWDVKVETNFAAPWPATRPHYE